MLSCWTNPEHAPTHRRPCRHTLRRAGDTDDIKGICRAALHEIDWDKL